MDAKTLASHVTVMVGINIIDDLVCDEDITVPLFNTDLTLVCVQIEGVGSIKDDVRRHFRTKLKNIFTKFIRKFG